MKTLIRLLKEESGTTIFEYAMISGLVTMTALAVVTAWWIKFMGLL